MLHALSEPCERGGVEHAIILVQPPLRTRSPRPVTLVLYEI